MSTDYGRDVSCLDGLRTGRYASGVRLVAEAAYRRLTTPRGTLRGGEDEADYGIDLAGLIGHESSPATVASVEGQIRSELLKDERITSVDVDIVSTQTGPSVSWLVTISVQTGEGPFDLTLAVADVSVEVVGVTTGDES